MLDLFVLIHHWYFLWVFYPLGEKLLKKVGIRNKDNIDKWLVSCVRACVAVKEEEL